jgi:putative two-component system response regulator
MDMNFTTAAHKDFTILLVDDSYESLVLLGQLFIDKYKVKFASSGKEALEIAFSDTPPDLILLDVSMPEMDGYEVCLALKQSAVTKNIPIVFLTVSSRLEDEKKGFELGAVDFVKKPIQPQTLLVRVANHLTLKASTDLLRSRTEYLEAELSKSAQEIQAIQNLAIRSLVSLAETRDMETGNHILRTQLYVKYLALQLQEHPRFFSILSDKYIDTLYRSAPLHDIGKVGIPDHILLKPGRLTAEEFEIMKMHPTFGRDAIDKAERSLGVNAEFLTIAKEIAYGHHEKWDGSGYPQQLSGDRIPVSARLMALADVYDALTSRRVYKKPIPHEQALDIILKGRGTHFDPDIVDAFHSIHVLFMKTALRYLDSDEDLEAVALRQKLHSSSPMI